MTTLRITLDGSIETQLLEMGKANGVEPQQLASRLLTRAILAARPRPVFDLDAVCANVAEFEAKDLALADSDGEHRSQILSG